MDRLLSRSPQVAIAIIAACVGAPAAMAAPSLVCQDAEASSIVVDGRLDDWQGVARARSGPDRDASFDVQCLIVGDGLHLAVQVRDERVVRDGRAALAKAAGQDHLVVELPGLVVTVFPGAGRAKPSYFLGRKPFGGRGFVLEDSLQPDGWSLELRVPLARIRGWTPDAATVAAAVRLRDHDVPRLAVADHHVEWEGDLVVGEVVDAMAGFLTVTGLRRDALRLDVQAEVDPGSPGRERVVAGGDLIAVLTDRFHYVRLPVERADDVIGADLLALGPDGTQLIAAHVRQRAGDGSRELLTLWTAAQGELRQVEAIEVAKQRGPRRLRSAWQVEPARKWKAARGARQVLVVRAGAATDWNPETYQEDPPGDAEAIHLPWTDDRVGGVFWSNKAGEIETAPIAR